MLNPCVVNPKVGPLSSHSCHCSDALRRHDIRHQRFAHTRAVRGLVCSILQATTERCGNLAMRLRVGPLCSAISFLHCRAGLDESRTNRLCKSIQSHAANFACGVGPCVGIVEPFKRVLRVTPHPQILALELRAPMHGRLLRTIRVIVVM